MKIARCVEEEAMLEESLIVDQEASIEVSVGKIRIYHLFQNNKRKFRSPNTGGRLNIPR